MIGCFEPKSFSRTIVKSFHGMDYLTICYGPKVPAFRKVLADETIGIFIGSSFPGRIWMGKIKVTFQSLCDFLMIPKLFSIIRCNRMNLFRYRTQQSFYRTFGVFLCSSIHFVNKSKARFSFCQRDNGLFMGFTNNSICFPVSNSTPCINNIRTFINDDPVLKVSPSFIGSITLLSQPVIELHLGVEFKIKNKYENQF